MANRYVGERICVICGLSSNEGRVHFNERFNVALCLKHAYQLNKNGKPFEETMYTRNKIEEKNDYATIELKDRNFNIVGHAIIDIEDINKCKNIKWAMRKSKNTCYVYGLVNGMLEGLHRFVLNYHGELQVDHINRNGLDNRKENLRIIPKKLNQLNADTSGVVKLKDGYLVKFQCDKIAYYCGRYNTYEEAKQKASEYREKYINNKESFLNEYKTIKENYKKYYITKYKNGNVALRMYNGKTKKHESVSVYNSVDIALKEKNKLEKELINSG